MRHRAHRAVRPTAAILGALTASVTVAAGGARARAQVSMGASVPARSELQAAARLPRDARLGDALASSRRVSITVALKPRIGLAAFAAAVSDPHSADYHHFLTPSQFAHRFGASAADVAAVRAALAGDGLRVARAGAGRLSIAVSGTAAQVQRALHTRLRRVRLPGGAGAYADTVAPSLPASLAGAVQGVVGLDSLPELRPLGLSRAHARASVATARPRLIPGGPGDCPDADATADTAQDIASAYGMTGQWAAGNTGTGTTVALVELEPFSEGDIDAYDSCYGISPTINVVDVNGGAGSGAGSGEAALDIEDIAGLAPGATIDVYEAPNNDLHAYNEMNQIVTADTARVISTSWGDCEAVTGSTLAMMENTLFEKAASQGQTVFAAAGDRGTDDCANGSASVDDPASQPDVTGVGGTSMPDAGDPADETVWNDASGAGGGGQSSLWSAPSYQSALGAGNREVPDVSADADPDTGYAIFYDGRWGSFGGTSAAAPTWAALTALAESSSDCASQSGGLGLLNSTLYALPESDFHDVTSGDNAFAGVPGWPATTGYDMASGLGAPDGDALIPALCAAGARGSVTGVRAGAAPAQPTVTTAPTTTTTDPTTTVSPPAPPTATATVTTSTTTPTAITPTTAPTTTPTRGPAADVLRVIAPARVTSRVGHRARVAVRASSSGRLRLTFSARRLPPGMRISPSTGIISGRPTRAGRFTVTMVVTTSAGDARSEVIRWTVERRAR